MNVALSHFKFSSRVVVRCLVEFSDGVCQVSANRYNVISAMNFTYCQILCFIALFRFLGPAEVITWGLLGYVWTLFGSFSDGFADAAELRCTYHLDMNRPEKARSSAYKSIYLSLHCGIFCTSIIFLVGEDLVGWITPDPTLQSSAAELLPLVGIGQVAMATSAVSWSLVRAQGRNAQANIVHFVGNWCTATLMGALLIILFRINLQGLLAALVLGYTIGGFGNLYILSRSQWDRIAKLMAASYQTDDPSTY